MVLGLNNDARVVDVIFLEFCPHLSPHEARAQGDRRVHLLDSRETHTVVVKPALPAATVDLLAAVHGQGRQGGAMSLPLAQPEGRGLGADGTKDGSDANDDEGAEARSAVPRLVVNKKMLQVWFLRSPSIPPECTKGPQRLETIHHASTGAATE